MEILQGMVQDPGYQDEPCTYGKVDDNTIYYFVKDYQLPNGNIIATTNLKEAIDHAAHTQLGLIDKNGKILIPFENKNIKKLKDNLLLVERNVPVTESVVNAFKNKSDPFSVQSISENTANIKRQIKSVMGMNGDFIFDNQFSEAAIYTIDGLNVAGNYFSFIGENNGDYYLATNVLGATIMKFNPSQLEMQKGEVSTENQTNSENENIQPSTNIGVSLTSSSVDDPPIPVVQQNIDQTELTQSDSESNVNQSQEIVQADNEDNSQEVKLDIALNNDFTEKDDDQEITMNTDTQENSSTEEIDSSSTNNDNNEVEMTTDIDNDNEKESENILGIDNDSNSGNEQQVDDKINSYSIDDEEIETKEEMQPDVEERHLKPYSLTDEDIATPTIKDATNIIRKLLEENRKQRIEIDRQNGEIETLKSNYDILSESSTSQKDEIDNLRNEMMKYRSQTIELTRKNIKLEGTLTRQTDIMKNLETQNTALREQVAGMNALSKAVAEANILVNQVDFNNADATSYNPKSEMDSYLSENYLDNTKENEITYGTFNGENPNPIPNIQNSIEEDPSYQKKLAA